MKKLSFLLSILAVLVLASCQPKDPELKIDYEKYQLDNGLEVILHQDHSDPVVSLAVQYHVGSNREVLGRTGFAHLFEHMMFQRSENVPEDKFFEYIQNAGGTLNGGTGNDNTTYFEVVPKNAMEMILWMESDRMGYMINTVTEKSFAIQQNVVQNEKRQMVDNRPYGHTNDVICKALYPEGHPYSWQVIGEMEDLQNATVADVKEFHQKFYVPNNATLVLAGDFEKEDAKALVEKYFAEIPAGDEVKDPKSMPVSLDETKKFYYEDNFARVPQYRMVYPTVEQYHDDAYALRYLGQLFSRGKSAPMYKVLEKDKKLTSSYYAYNGSQELAGRFNISVTANAGTSLKDVEEAVFEAYKMFEEEGITEEDVERVKASLETNFYNGISSVLGKSFQLASYNEFAGDPSYYKTDIEKLKSVTKEDIMRVYEKYIKGKPYIATSFVPKGQSDLIAEGSVEANIEEEDIKNATEVEVAHIEEEEIEKTPSKIDRSQKPAIGADPLLNIPEVWQADMANGMEVYGIEQNELPLVNYNIVLRGGHYLDDPAKPGVANLVASLMTEGTQNKTPQELEEEIEMLGARINMYAGDNDITISVNTLARNYEKTLALVEEMLLQPRWDEEEFEMAKRQVLNRLKRQKASPNYLGDRAFSQLVYGKDHIFAYDRNGTEESVQNMTIDDLKAYYEANFSPSVATFHVAGDIDQQRVESSLENLTANWEAKDVEFPEYEIPAGPEKSKVYFVDVPGAKQSVITIGNMSISSLDEDYYPATVMNQKLGGSFNGWVNMVLREEKGYTYGARSYFEGGVQPGPFRAGASVRSTATLESVQIFHDLMAKYRDGISNEELDFTKNSLIKSNARRFETLYALLGMLESISTYDMPVDYIKERETIVKNMTLEQHQELAKKYLNPEKMYYVIAGDAKTQLKELEKLGYGKPELVSL